MDEQSGETEEEKVIIGVDSYGALGHVPPSTYNNLFFTVYTLTSDSLTATITLTLAQCKHPITFVPLLAPNPGDATRSDG